MTLAVDASSALAVGLLKGGEPLVAPELVLAEVCHAARKLLCHADIDQAQFNEVATGVVEVPHGLVPLDRLVRLVAALGGTPLDGRLRPLA